MPDFLRLELSNIFYEMASGEATRFDISAYDWYGMYCNYQI